MSCRKFAKNSRRTLECGKDPRQQPCRPAQRPCRSDSPYKGEINISNATFRLDRQRFQASPFVLPKVFSHHCRLVSVCSVLQSILKKKTVIARLLFHPDSSRSQAAFPAVVPDLPKKGGPKAPALLRKSSAPSPFRWLPPGMSVSRSCCAHLRWASL